MTDFLDKDYQPDASQSSYMRFEQGANKFRILEKPIIGYEWWIHEDKTIVVKGEKSQSGNKPVRTPKKKDHELYRALNVEEFDNSKEFWAMPVWNYKRNKIELLEITQSGIIKTITTLARDTEWGSPLGYDITVSRTGEGMETEYEVVPAPPKPLTQEQENAWKEANINTEALFKGGDPFAESHESSDDAALDELDAVIGK